MKASDLNTTQLFIAGSIASRLAEELQKGEMDKDTKKAAKYLLKQLDNINKEIAGQILIDIYNGFEKIRKEMENEQ